MKAARNLIGFFILVLMTLAGFSIGFAMELNSIGQKRPDEVYGRLPLYFIENKGQLSNKEVRFYEKSPKHTTYFTRNGIYMVFSVGSEKKTDTTLHFENKPEYGKSEENLNYIFQIIKLSFEKGNEFPEIVGEEMHHSRVSYLNGNNKENWQTNIPVFRAVRYRNIYPGIDLRFYANNLNLQYDIIVAPGL